MNDMGSIEGSIEATAGGSNVNGPETGGGLNNGGAGQETSTGPGSDLTIAGLNFNGPLTVATTSDIAGLGIGMAGFLAAAAVAGDVPGVGTAIAGGATAFGGLVALAGNAAAAFSASGAPAVMANNPQASLGLYGATSDPIAGPSFGIAPGDNSWQFAGNQ